MPTRNNVLKFTALMIAMDLAASMSYLREEYYPLLNTTYGNSTDANDSSHANYSGLSIKQVNGIVAGSVFFFYSVFVVVWTINYMLDYAELYRSREKSFECCDFVKIALSPVWAPFAFYLLCELCMDDTKGRALRNEMDSPLL